MTRVAVLGAGSWGTTVASLSASRIRPFSGPAAPASRVTDEALRLRDLLKFDFFFPVRDDFLAQLDEEFAILDERLADGTLAPLVVRPFLEAYLVVAEVLCATASTRRIDDRAFLEQCLGVGRQWLLQRRLSSAESVSLELFRTGLELARHRGLGGPGGPELATERAAFAAELRELLGRVAAIGRRPALEDHVVTEMPAVDAPDIS